MDAFALDLRPLVDDGEDEEAEDDDGEPDLQGEAHPFAAGWLGPESRPCFTDPVEEWLPSLHSAVRLVTFWDSQPMGEFELLARCASGCRRRARGCASAAATTPRSRVPGGATATSVDALVEGVHFRRETASLRQIGRKALVDRALRPGGDGSGAGRGLRGARGARGARRGGAAGARRGPGRGGARRPGRRSPAAT